MTNNQLYTYADLLASSPATKHILLGNGFSISCDPIFQYNNIYEFAQNHGLSPRVLELFKHFGTTNFELVARSLTDTIFVGELYKMLAANQEQELQEGIAQIKEALVSAIAQTHLATPDGIAEASRSACVQFLKPYQNVFTTNYDLLLYWTSMKGLFERELSFEDGFSSSIDDPDANYVVFSSHLGRKKGLFYLHGALHLFEEGGQVRKHCWKRSGVSLTENVIHSLELNNFPLFVAEGSSVNKLETIQRNGYLSYCYQKLERLESTLVVCGNALGESDEHILRAIGDGAYTTVWLGVYGNSESTEAKQMRVVAVRLEERRKKSMHPAALDVKLYDVRTAPIWTVPFENVDVKKPTPVFTFPKKLGRTA